MRRHERSELAALLTVVALAVTAGLAGALWQAKQNRDASDRAISLTGGDPRRGARLMRQYGCAGCHHIPRVPEAEGRVGPSLHQFAGRSYIAGTLENTPDNLTRFLQDAPALVPGTAMPRTGASAQDARDMAAFLYTRSYGPGAATTPQGRSPTGMSATRTSACVSITDTSFDGPLAV